MLQMYRRGHLSTRALGLSCSWYQLRHTIWTFQKANIPPRRRGHGILHWAITRKRKQKQVEWHKAITLRCRLPRTSLYPFSHRPLPPDATWNCLASPSNQYTTSPLARLYLFRYEEAVYAWMQKYGRLALTYATIQMTHSNFWWTGFWNIKG
jgi:hypothetical protein